MNFRNALKKQVVWSVFGLLCLNVSAPVFALEAPVKRVPLKATPPTPTLKWQQTQLFFGLSRPDGTRITRREWERFAAKEITARFPDGFTLMEGMGQWRMKGGPIVHENTKILILLHAPNEYSERAITKIIAAYKKQFAQESVLRASSEVRVQF